MVDVDAGWVSHFPPTPMVRCARARATFPRTASASPAPPASSRFTAQLGPINPPSPALNISPGFVSVAVFLLFSFSLHPSESTRSFLTTTDRSNSRPTELPAELNPDSDNLLSSRARSTKFDQIRRRLEHALPIRSRTVFIPAKQPRQNSEDPRHDDPGFEKYWEKLAHLVASPRKRPRSAFA